MYLSRRKDGNKLTAGEHYDIESDDANEVYKLKIKGILLEDGGLYTVSAVNSVGEASADAKLKIHSKATLSITNIISRVPLVFHPPSYL